MKKLIGEVCTGLVRETSVPDKAHKFTISSIDGHFYVHGVGRGSKRHFMVSRDGVILTTYFYFVDSVADAVKRFNNDCLVSGMTEKKVNEYINGIKAMQK